MNGIENLIRDPKPLKLKFISLLLLIILVSSINLGCIKQSEGKKTKLITDMADREIEIPTEIDEVVGVGAGALRIITYLNATDKVVGVEQFEKDHNVKPYNYAHPELTNLPSIGPQHGGNAELIAKQNPDIILYTYTTAGEATDLQEKTGIPVVVLKYGDLGKNRDKLNQALKLSGKVLNKKKRAKNLIDYIDSLINDLNERTKEIPKDDIPEVYAGGIGFHGTHGIVSTEPNYTPFEFINADNVASSLGLEHVMVSKEKIIEWDPEIIFIDEGGYKLVMKDLKSPEFKSLKAVEKGELYGLLPYNYYTTNYGTVLANTYYIGKILYPNRFEDLNSVEKADKIYKEFVGEGVYDQMKERYGGFKKINLENMSDPE